MSQKFRVDGFKWKKKKSRFTQKFIQDYDDDSDKRYNIGTDVSYPKRRIQKIHSDLLFLLEKMKIDKRQKLVHNTFDKKNYAIHTKALKLALDYKLILEKVHKVIRFNQEAWLKPYIYMSTELRSKAKNDSEKDFFKLMNNSVFRKTMENVTNHRHIKLVATDKRRSKLAPGPNYNTIKQVLEKLLAIKMNKINVIMNKPVYQFWK